MMENKVTTDNNPSDHNTISTTTLSSTDQLICKTPRESPSCSIKSEFNNNNNNNTIKKCSPGSSNWLLVLGGSHCFFGMLMTTFGLLTIHHEANLSRSGAGIWGGFLATFTGIAGILSSAPQNFCPLKPTPQKIVHTTFLALSLVSLAVAQLVAALAAIGSGRDYNKMAENQINPTAIFLNVGLLLVSLGEFVVSAISSYKSSRTLCRCFRRNSDFDNFSTGDPTARNEFVNSWLGHHNAPQIYLVAGPPSSLGGGKKGKMSGLPVFAFPAGSPVGIPSPPPRVVSLIPAPLGQIPSPVIPPTITRDLMMSRDCYRHKRRHHHQHHQIKKTQAIINSRSHSRSRSKSKDRDFPPPLLSSTATEKDVAKTYTGLDKTIAEEFIDICDSSASKHSNNNSLCSASCSCNNSSNCTSTTCTTCSSNSNSSSSNGSEVASRDFLVVTKS